MYCIVCVVKCHSGTICVVWLVLETRDKEHITGAQFSIMLLLFYCLKLSGSYSLNSLSLSTIAPNDMHEDTHGEKCIPNTYMQTV